MRTYPASSDCACLRSHNNLREHGPRPTAKGLHTPEVATCGHLCKIDHKGNQIKSRNPTDMVQRGLDQEHNNVRRGAKLPATHAPLNGPAKRHRTSKMMRVISCVAALRTWMHRLLPWWECVDHAAATHCLVHFWSTWEQCRYNTAAAHSRYHFRLGGQSKDHIGRYVRHAQKFARFGFSIAVTSRALIFAATMKSFSHRPPATAMMVLSAVETF